MLQEKIPFHSMIDLLQHRAQTQSQSIAYKYLSETGEIKSTLTYGQLEEKAITIASKLQSVSKPGDRALLLYSPGLDFITAFFGCLYAGVIAIPAYPPKRNRNLNRLNAIVSDAEATIILSTEQIMSKSYREKSVQYEMLLDKTWIATDTLPFSNTYELYKPDSNSIAFLQYTSGSTGNPKGVMVSHNNLLHNLDMIRKQWNLTEKEVFVSWLPVFHDMGLIGKVLASLYLGSKAILMAPASFLQNPYLWLETISKYKGTISSAPNFAYDLCVEKISDEAKKSLDLRHWRTVNNGAEPIRAETIQRFSDSFTSCGFNPNSWAPCYGLAEGTLLVSGGSNRYPIIKSVQKEALKENQIIEVESDLDESQLLVGSGKATSNLNVAIVNPETLEECPNRKIGEIWVAGPNVALGYWNKEENKKVFGQVIEQRKDEFYLRTGDLGFLDDGELFVTGRLKDLIILHGSNYYPQDIEQTVENSHPSLKKGCGACFTVPINSEEQLIIVQEISRHIKKKEDQEEVIEEIRKAIAKEHEIPLYSIVLIREASIPKTSSGKIQRKATRSYYLEDKLITLYKWERPVQSRQPSIPPNPEQNQNHSFKTVAEAEAWIASEISRAFQIDAEQIDVHQPFSYYGLDSIQLVELAEKVQNQTKQPLPVTSTWDYPTISELAEFIVNENDSRSTTNVLNEVNSEPIAVVGIGCHFPQAETPEEFWNLLCNEVDTIIEVPKDRWDIDKYFDEDPSVPGKTSSRWGGFLNSIDSFDPSYFSIQPREAASMDPQQRIILETTAKSLADAGIPQKSLAGTRTGVFIGISTSEYSQILFNDPQKIDIYSGTGSAHSIAANRISYFLDLRGPSIAVDTACSSSLTAIHQACQSIKNGESEIALAGGVNLILSPDLSINFSKMGAMAPDGRCKTFDEKANGYVRGEGAGVVVLKKLSDAIANNDRIYAVIRGSAVNQDGRSNGITAPNRQAQEAVLADAYHQANISPGQVDYVEAHGTGTPLGDPIEVTALGKIISKDRPLDRPCSIGSVKTNIGHLEAAAGIAGFIKTVLALHHRQIPASLHYHKPNSHIPFENLPIVVQKETAPWPEKEEGQAIAGVSSFGFGGTNAHVVLGEYHEQNKKQQLNSSSLDTYILPISAHNEHGLPTLAKSYQDYLDQQTYTLKNVSYTAAIRRDHYSHRAALIASSLDEMKEQLLELAEGHIPIQTSSLNHKLAFIYSGHGGYWLNAGKEWINEPVFLEALKQCDEILQSYHLGWSVLSELQADSESSRVQDDGDIQLMVFSIQVALTSLWNSWGIYPSAVAGHSMGEVTAAYAAGILSLKDAIHIMYYRSRLLLKVQDNGKMVAVALSPEQIKPWLKNQEDQIFISVINSPNSVILSGDSYALDTLVDSLKKHKIPARFLKAKTAGHCSLIEPIHLELESLLEGLTPNPGNIPFISTVTGQVINGTELNAAYWSRNLREPVLFYQALEQLVLNQHCDTFVEIGPHSVLMSSIREGLHHLNCEAGSVFPSLQQGKSDQYILLTALGKLYTLGFDIDWKKLYPDGELESLPAFAWKKERYWFDHAVKADNKNSLLSNTLTEVNNLSDLLSKQPVSFSKTGDSFWEMVITGIEPSFISDHRIIGTTVYPAASYLDIILRGARQRFKTDDLYVTDISFKEMLILSEEENKVLQVVISPPSYNQADFQIMSRAPHDDTEDSWTLHASGKVSIGGVENVTSIIQSLEEVKQQLMEEQSVSEHYERMSSLGGEYGPSFRGIKQLWGGDNEALGYIELPKALESDKHHYLAHPALLDAAFQVLANTTSNSLSSDLYLPVNIQNVRIHDEITESVWSYAVLNQNSNSANDIIGDILLFNEDGKVIGEINGFQAQRITLNERQRSWSEDLYEVSWIESPVQTENNMLPAFPGHWVVLADDSGIGEHLVESLTNKGDTCTIVYPTNKDFIFTDPISYIDPANQQHYKRLFNEIMSKDSPCKGILSLWSLNATPISEMTDQSIMQDQKLASGSTLHVVQTISQSSLNSIPRLWLITKGAFAIKEQEVKINQTPLWGLGNVIASEHPELRCAYVDLDPNSSVETNSNALLHELLSNEEESKILLREYGRFVSRLDSYSLMEDENNYEIISSDQAFQLKISQRGSIEHLQLEEADISELAPDEVKIEVITSGINFNDILNMLNKLPIPDKQDVPGWECSGRIVAVGTKVKEFKVGDEVVALSPKSIASHVVTNHHLVVHKPKYLTFEEAATIPVAFLTAYYSLYHCAGVKQGEKVLIHSASGGVGLAAVQLAQYSNAEIFATAGTDERKDYLYSLGIKHVLDSRKLDFAEEIMDLTGGKGVDIVLNSLTGEAMQKSLSVLNFNGAFVELGVSDIYSNNQIGLAPFKNCLSYYAVGLLYICQHNPSLIGKMFKEIMSLFQDGLLKPLPLTVFPITDVNDAFKYMVSRQHIGKVIVTNNVDQISVKHNIKVKPNASYLISGGLSGLGLLTAKWLVQKGADHLVLLGRSTPTPQTQKQLDEWKSQGIQIYTAQVDVSNYQQVSDLINVLYKNWPPISGIIHSATVLDDGILTLQNWKRFEKVLLPKMVGAWNLHTLTTEMKLDFFVLYSSAASLFGSPGQGNYVVANTFLDALSHYRHRLGLPSLSINWGPWSQFGRAESVDSGGRLAHLGIKSIKPSEGIWALDNLITNKTPQVAVFSAEWKEVLSSFGDNIPPLFENIRNKAIQENRSDNLLPINLSNNLNEVSESQQKEVIENYIKSTIAEVLRIPISKVNTQQSLSQLGMDSLMGIELKNKLESDVGLLFPIADLLGSPSIDALTNEVLSRILGESQAVPTIETDTETQSNNQPLTEGPLGYNQQSIWFMQQLSPKSPAYNIPKAVRIPVELNIPILKQSFQDLIDRHEMLRATFPIRNNEPYLKIHQHLEVDFQIIDCSLWSDEFLHESINKESNKPFNLEDGPLFRIHLFKKGTKNNILLLNFHHIITDGWSIWNLLLEFNELYRAGINNETPTLPLIQTSYTKHIKNQTEMMSGEYGQKLLDFWKEKLDGANTILNLPTDKPRPKVQSLQGASFSRRLNQKVSEKIKELSIVQNTTIYPIMLATWSILLSRYTGQKEILIGSPFSGRNTAELANIQGNFVNMVLMRGDLTENHTFKEFLKQTRESVLEALSYQDYPFSKLVQQLNIPRDPSRSPLVQVSLSWQQSQVNRHESMDSFALNIPGVSLELEPLVFELFPINWEGALWDLAIIMSEVDDTFGVMIQYDTNLFYESTIQRIVNDFEILLNELILDPDQII